MRVCQSVIKKEFLFFRSFFRTGNEIFFFSKTGLNPPHTHTRITRLNTIKSRLELSFVVKSRARAGDVSKRVWKEIVLKTHARARTHTIDVETTGGGGGGKSLKFLARS